MNLLIGFFGFLFKNPVWLYFIILFLILFIIIQRIYYLGKILEIKKEHQEFFTWLNCSKFHLHSDYKDLVLEYRRKMVISEKATQELTNDCVYYNKYFNKNY